jgi:hypothetical protein
MATIVGVAVLGFVVLVASAGGQVGGGVAPTPTRTVEETSALSDRLRAEDQARTVAVADAFISEKKPIATLERAELDALVTEPPGLAAALRSAAAVITGRVEGQFLERADVGTGGLPRAMVVSMLRMSDGMRSIVSQPVTLELGRSSGALVLGFLPGQDILRVGLTYSFPVDADPATGRVSPVRGHIYVVDSAGLLGPPSEHAATSRNENALGHSSQWLSALFEAAQNGNSVP